MFPLVKVCAGIPWEQRVGEGTQMGSACPGGSSNNRERGNGRKLVVLRGGGCGFASGSHCWSGCEVQVLEEVGRVGSESGAWGSAGLVPKELLLPAWSERG